VNALVRTAASTGRVGVVLVSSAVTGLLVGGVAQRLAGNRMAPWIVGRASGIVAYLLLVTLVLAGLVLSHPGRARLHRPSAVTRIRLHVALALFTGAALAVHVVVLATDRWAGVGWFGAVVPMGASYRPAAVTLGVVATWLGILAGASAALAGRLPRRAWWPLHKVAAATLVLTWLHGVLAGGDTTALLAMYRATGVVVVAAAVWRYTARRPAEQEPT
jgi:hypothetical protein